MSAIKTPEQVAEELWPAAKGWDETPANAVRGILADRAQWSAWCDAKAAEADAAALVSGSDTEMCDFHQGRAEAFRLVAATVRSAS